MKKSLLFTLTLGLIVILTQSMCTKECLRSQDFDNQKLFRDGYALSYNEDHEQANWVFYVMKQSDLVCDEGAKRKNNFKEDRDIATGSAQLSDYKKSGYDRGHLKASADESCDQIQMDETFLMSNMSPQVPGFNRGIWKKLEAHVRDLALDNDSLYVYTAGVLTETIDTIGANNVTVPAKYYKIIYAFKDGYAKTSAYLIPNEKTSKSYEEFETSVFCIEDKTNISFPNPHDKDKYPKFYCH